MDDKASSEFEWRSSLGDEALSVHEVEDSRSPSRFRKFLRLFRVEQTGPRKGNDDSGEIDDDKSGYLYEPAPVDEDMESFLRARSTRRYREPRSAKWSRRLRKAILTMPVVILCLLGLLHILLVLFGSKQHFWDLQEHAQYLPDWVKLDHAGEPGLMTLDLTRNVSPIPCHSHNDYWRKHPLFDALSWGCTSVEADVWHFDDEEELFVGHNTASLTHTRTFRSLYVDRIVEMLDRINLSKEDNDVKARGIFELDPEQTLVLLIDFKTDGHDLFPQVQRQLEPLRQGNYLSHWDGERFISRAVTVVGTGNTPFDRVIESSEYRDIFFDAPLAALYEPKTKRAASPAQGETGTHVVSSPNDFNVTNSYYASVSFSASIGFPWRGYLTEQQLSLIRGQIAGAKRKGLKARYWETPNWPTSLRNHVWEVLVTEGADILNVDDLRSAASMDWSAPVDHGWLDA